LQFAVVDHPNDLEDIGRVNMKKRINPMAVALWLAAGVYLIAKVAALALIGSFASRLAGVSPSGLEENFPMNMAIHLLDSVRVLEAVPTAVLGAGELAALGTVIELLDRIRWQGSAQNSN
jgi:hypothetical protein